MKNRSIFLLSGLVIGLAFSVLLVRMTSLECENAWQCEQIAVMRETATQAREAFDRTQDIPHTTNVIHTFPPASEGQPSDIPIPDVNPVKALDAEIQKLETVSKER